MTSELIAVPAVVERRRVLVLGDSLAVARLKVKYRDTWICRLKGALPNDDVISLSDGGRMTKYLAINPTKRPDGTIEYDPYSLESFEPGIVILSLGIVDCAPRIFSRKESYFVGKFPAWLREMLIFLAKRLRTRDDRRAYVSPGEFEENVRQYLERCRKAGVERVVIVGIATPDSRGLLANPGLASAAARYNDIYRRLCQTFEFATFTDPLRPSEDVSPLYIEDGYHLSPYGHFVAYEAILKALGLNTQPIQKEVKTI